MFRIIKLVLVFLRLSDSKLVGSCNQCLASNKVACLNEQQFSICFKGSVTATVTKCPDKHVCTNDERICRPTAEGYTPICYNEYCGECAITNGIFACLDDVTYGYCFGANTPLESTLRSCPRGYVCNHNYREVCVPGETHLPSCAAKTTKTTTEISTIATDFTTDKTTDSTTEATTLTTTKIPSTVEQLPATTQMTIEITTTEAAIPTTETTELSTTPTTAVIITIEMPSVTATSAITETSSTTAKSPITETTEKINPLDANSICRQIRQIGYFKSADATCRQYVYCYLLSGQYLGWFYYCDFYFNVATQSCQEERPPNCVAY